MIEFAAPWVLLLMPLPLFVYFLLPKIQGNTQSIEVPFFTRASLANNELSHKAGRSPKPIKLVSLVLIWLCLLTAAAQPLRYGTAVPIPTEGRDLMLAMDISGSMSTADMQIENERFARILIVKHIIGEFLDERKGDRVGLILFGTNAYLQAPLTFDLATVNQFLDETTLRLAGERTAIGDAIGLAVKRLKDRPKSQRVLILLTDGENNAGNIEPKQAADLAAQAGIKIYTIGVGAESIEVSRGFFGGTQRVNPSSDLDETTLQYISEKTGGLYFRARNPQELQGIYATLDELEVIEQEKAIFRPVEHLYYLPLALAVVLLTVMFSFILIVNTRLSSLFTKTGDVKQSGVEP